MRLIKNTLLVLMLVAGLSGCSLVVGTEAWCKAMKEKPAGDWSANAAADFAKHCILK